MTTPVQSIPRGPASSLARPIAIGSDDRLARLAGDGHERAFGVLYERYHQRLYRYLRSMLRHDADAQDALQATFAKAFTALADDRRDAPLRPWLYRIAHNEAITVMRRRRPEVGLAAAGDLPTPSADEQADGRARLALLVTDLAELTERQRGALVMRELSGLSHEEIEAALELEPGGAKATIFEARRSLAEFAQGRDMSCDDVCRAISDGNGRTLRGRKIRAHLRDCGGCAAFAAAIPGRSRDLRALAPPLPAAAAAGILAKLLGSGSGAGGAGAAGGGAGAAATTATGVGKVVALSISSKALAGAAVAVIAAGAGAVIVPTLHSAGHASAARGGHPGIHQTTGAHVTSSHRAAGTRAPTGTAPAAGRSAARHHGAGGHGPARGATGSHGHAGRSGAAHGGRRHTAATSPGSRHARHGAGPSAPVGAHGPQATGHVISTTAGHSVARRLGVTTAPRRTPRPGSRPARPKTHTMGARVPKRPTPTPSLSSTSTTVTSSARSGTAGAASTS